MFFVLFCKKLDLAHDYSFEPLPVKTHMWFHSVITALEESVGWMRVVMKACLPKSAGNRWPFWKIASFSLLDSCSLKWLQNCEILKDLCDGQMFSWVTINKIQLNTLCLRQDIILTRYRIVWNGNLLLKFRLITGLTLNQKFHWVQQFVFNYIYIQTSWWCQWYLISQKMHLSLLRLIVSQLPGWYVYLWILNVYFLTNLSNLTLVTIKGDGVEILDPYKFLGGQQTAVVRQYRGPLSEMTEQVVLFNVCTRLLQMFSHSVVTSVIFLAVVCWEGGKLHLWCPSWWERTVWTQWMNWGWKGRWKPTQIIFLILSMLSRDVLGACSATGPSSHVPQSVWEALSFHKIPQSNST